MSEAASAGRERDQPRLPYSDHLARHFKSGYPPRHLVEPMVQGHGKTSDDYRDLRTASVHVEGVEGR